MPSPSSTTMEPELVRSDSLRGPTSDFSWAEANPPRLAGDTAAEDGRLDLHEVGESTEVNRRSGNDSGAN